MAIVGQMTMSMPRNTKAVLVTATMLASMGLAFIAATPAHATTGQCISYLEQKGEDTVARNEVCQTTEVLADNVSDAYARQYCHAGMLATGLDAATTKEACERALQD
jgi:hypothetical protein